MTDSHIGSTLSAGAAPGWMVVGVGDARVSLPIESVGEVLPPPELSAVPMAPPWVAGIASVRDEVVPVVDATRRLRGTQASPEGRLVLVTIDESGDRVGLLVDAVAGLIERAGADVSAAASKSQVLPPRFIGATVSRGDMSVPVLDFGALLDPAIESA